MAVDLFCTPHTPYAPLLACVWHTERPFRAQFFPVTRTRTSLVIMNLLEYCVFRNSGHHLDPTSQVVQCHNIGISPQISCNFERRIQY